MKKSIESMSQEGKKPESLNVPSEKLSLGRSGNLRDAIEQLKGKEPGTYISYVSEKFNIQGEVEQACAEQGLENITVENLPYWGGERMYRITVQKSEKE